MHASRDPTEDHRSLFSLPPGALYLNTASDGPRLHAVLQAARDAINHSTMPWRLDMAGWTARIERVRTLASRLFDGDAGGVALVPSAGYGLSTAARNVPLWPGQAVLVLEGQFPSNLLPWQRRCREVGAQLVAVPRIPGIDWTEAVLATLHRNKDIRILALPHAYWHDGALLDLDRISEAARERGASLVLDLSQSLGVLPADVARWQPEFAVAVGHKWLLGGSGLAYLWAAPQWRAEGEPLEQNWIARTGRDDWRFPPDAPPPYLDGARRYDAGGVADPLRLAMAEAALAQVLSWQALPLSEALGKRTAALRTALDNRGLGDWLADGHAPHLCGVRPPGDRLAAVAGVLEEAGVIVTVRHGLVRIAPHLHVEARDMVRVADLMARAA
ncbi:aminotransferase class V-fold PLP-dependent enzyme [Luteimonas vadosa]